MSMGVGIHVYMYSSYVCHPYQWSLFLVGFDATDEERLARLQSSHESIKRALELETKGWSFLPSFCRLYRIKATCEKHR